MEDALLREGAKAGQRVQIHAEEVLPLQHGHALGIAAVLLRQLQPLCAAVGLRVICTCTTLISALQAALRLSRRQRLPSCSHNEFVDRFRWGNYTQQ